MAFDLEALLNRRSPSMKRPAAVYRRPSVVTVDSDTDIEDLLEAELNMDSRPPKLYLA